MSLIDPYGAAGYLPAGAPADYTDPWLEIDTAALAHNISQIRAKTGNVPLMGVVKANAYGHGAVAIAQELQQHGINRFAVAKVAAAIALRQSGFAGPILNLGPFSTQEARLLIQHNIEQSVYNETVDVLAAAARELGQPARVHIKIDTGLSRVGVPFGAALPFVVDVAARRELALAGLFTTLVEDAAFDPTQITRLQEVVAAVKAQGIDPGIVHAASSAAAIQGTAPLLDMVRVGNGFYGFEPQTLVDTKPILSLRARVITVKTLLPGDSIAYHRRGLIERETRVATLPVGYADGYPFNAVDHGAQVLIRGRRWPLIVYMSANHVTVDVTGDPTIQVGDEAVLFGRQGAETISISELAGWAGSSEYKICTNLSPLLPRIFRTD